jgi:hypothetical protein
MASVIYTLDEQWEDIIMQPWRVVRANCSFAKLVLQAPYSKARTLVPAESCVMSFVCLPIYIPAIPFKSLCKAQWLFFCFYLFSLFPLPCIPFKRLQRLMRKYHFSFFSPFFIFRWSNHVFTLCMSSLCCLAGSYCVLRPQRWPQSCSNFTVSSAASVKGVYKVIGSLLSCCNLWCKTQKETIEDCWACLNVDITICTAEASYFHTLHNSLKKG